MPAPPSGALLLEAARIVPMARREVAHVAPDRNASNAG
jgi:hypothetical protein